MRSLNCSSVGIINIIHWIENCTFFVNVNGRVHVIVTPIGDSIVVRSIRFAFCPIGIQSVIPMTVMSFDILEKDDPTSSLF